MSGIINSFNTNNNNNTNAPTLSTISSTFTQNNLINAENFIRDEFNRCVEKIELLKKSISEKTCQISNHETILKVNKCAIIKRYNGTDFTIKDLNGNEDLIQKTYNACIQQALTIDKEKVLALETSIKNDEKIIQKFKETTEAEINKFNQELEKSKEKLEHLHLLYHLNKDKFDSAKALGLDTFSIKCKCHNHKPHNPLPVPSVSSSSSSHLTASSLPAPSSASPTLRSSSSSTSTTTHAMNIKATPATVIKANASSTSATQNSSLSTPLLTPTSKATSIIPPSSSSSLAPSSVLATSSASSTIPSSSSSTSNKPNDAVPSSPKDNVDDVTDSDEDKEPLFNRFSKPQALTKQKKAPAHILDLNNNHKKSKTK